MDNILITGLFGHLNYRIECSDSEIVIITGPNGYGKTTILKIIDSIYNNSYSFLSEVSFSKIKMDVDSGYSVEIIKNNNSFVVTFNDLVDSKVFEFKNKNKSDNEMLSEWWDGNLPKLSIDDDFHQQVFGHVDCLFIGAQRVYDDGSNNKKINECSTDLVNKIRAISLEAAIISQRLDSSFPNRLFSNLSDDTIQVSSDTISNRLYGLELKKKDLMKYNLIESDGMSSAKNYLSEKISLNSRDILNLYIEDALNKLEPYQDIFDKLDLFYTLIIEKNFSFKKLKIDRHNGFYFVGSDGGEIPLSHLSSGEQNQVILYYKMIFEPNSRKKTLFLIDEPEISFHVTWQKEFLDSVERIKKLNLIGQMFFATHSPQIVNNRWGEGYFDLFDLSHEDGE